MVEEREGETHLLMPAAGGLRSAPRVALVPALTADFPIVKVDDFAEPAVIVRGHYRDWERRQGTRAAIAATRVGVMA